MRVIAKYHKNADGKMEVHVVSEQTGELDCIIPHQPESRRSMTWITELYAKACGHSITAWDRSQLTNGEVAA